ncbi:MAG: hypothetical protein ACJAY4_001897, partial [Cryomorphaceae bacterium]
MRKGWAQKLWLTPLFFTTGATAIFLCAFGFSFPMLFRLGQVVAAMLVVLSAADAVILFSKNVKLKGKRELPKILGLTDDTEVKILLELSSPMPLQATIIDELPDQLQKRNFRIEKTLEPGRNTAMYKMRPIDRGIYKFGTLNVLL